MLEAAGTRTPAPQYYSPSSVLLQYNCGLRAGLWSSLVSIPGRGTGLRCPPQRVQLTTGLYLVPTLRMM
jgi:hypothetical protein